MRLWYLLRKFCLYQELISAPGLLEFISEHDDGREALLTFINSFAEFVLREKSGHRERRLQVLLAAHPGGGSEAQSSRPLAAALV